ncbi:MAG: tRNA threonylcarbamoyladenosine dehydratase [Clostridia bacterium]|nr:tRNA threonylcarbamoyladenosine dehydratase [Clostridia bacterium]
MNEFVREERLIGKDAMEKLKKSRVAVFGVGGVGGYVVETLARAGVGALDLIDADTVSLTNINRQIIALHSTVGMKKTAVAAARVRDINPECSVREYPVFFDAETADGFDFSAYDYVVDAVDTVTAKIALIERAKAAGTPIICSMGTGNKLDPSRFEVSLIEKTDTDPLARVMRLELRKRHIGKVKCVYSKEIPQTPLPDEEAPVSGKHSSPASISFVPPAAGLLLAGEVIRDLIAKM